MYIFQAPLLLASDKYYVKAIPGPSEQPDHHHADHAEGADHQHQHQHEHEKAVPTEPPVTKAAMREDETHADGSVLTGKPPKIPRVIIACLGTGRYRALAITASRSHLDLGRAPHVLYGVKYIDLVPRCTIVWC